MKSEFFDSIRRSLAALQQTGASWFRKKPARPRPKSLFRRIVRSLADFGAHFMAVATAGVVIGFIVFAQFANSDVGRPTPAKIDAVVALTGEGGARLSASFAILRDHPGSRLLISGVNPTVTRDDLLKLSGATPFLFDTAVDIDFVAENTIANARETARWARQNSFSRLVVVTADYHMPRAMLEMRMAMPDGHFYAHAVRSKAPHQKWWSRADYLRRYGVEYVKFLATLGRSAWQKTGLDHGDPGANEHS